MAKQTLKDLAVQAVIEVKAKIKDIVETKKKGKVIGELPKDSLKVETVVEATRIKAEIEVLEAKLKVLQGQYKPLRDEILESLPGESKDKVQVVVDGILINKYSQQKGFGVVDQEALLEVLKKNKLLTKTTNMVRVIDEEAVYAAIASGGLSIEEYVSCLKDGKTIEMLKLERKFTPEVLIEEEELEAI